MERLLRTGSGADTRIDQRHSPVAMTIDAVISKAAGATVAAFAGAERANAAVDATRTAAAAMRPKVVNLGVEFRAFLLGKVAPQVQIATLVD